MAAYDIVSPMSLNLEHGWSAARRKDAQLLLDIWVKNEGFEDLLDFIYTGGDLQTYCDSHTLRISKVLKFIREDATRAVDYRNALNGSADRLMNETVKIADDVSISQLEMNRASLRIQARSRLAKTRAIGYDNAVRTEITGANGAPLPPVYVNFIPTGAAVVATQSDADPY